jgi:hypothetical protein
MKYVLMVSALVGTLVAPAAAQYWGMPLWNSPKGGSGVTVSADYGKPSDGWGSGNAFGARASVGLANITLTGGVSTWEPDGATDGFTSVGGAAAFRVIGGSLMPVAINLQLGAARVSEVTPLPAMTRLTVGTGISTTLPTPGMSIEPYLSLTNRWYKASGIDDVESNFGWTLGANLTFGMFGVHVAYDSESGGSESQGILGVGGHFAFRMPLGM